MLSGDHNNEFEALHNAGMAAKTDAPVTALAAFEAADQLAQRHDDLPKRLNALQPAARALWTMGHYNEAAEKLEAAAGIADELDVQDERGIITSNIGRLAAARIIKMVPVEQQAKMLKAEAAPQFRKAHGILKGHAHLYYRYANAQHGSVVAALAGERKLAGTLLVEGARVAFRKSAAPYDQQRTYQINPRGLVQLSAAAALLLLAGRTPKLAQFARKKLIS